MGRWEGQEASYLEAKMRSFKVGKCCSGQNPREGVSPGQTDMVTLTE